MSLRTKAIIIICVTLVVTIAALYGTSRLILTTGLSRIEVYDTQQSVQRTLNVLSRTISDLEANVADWAVWDDTYDFIADSNDEYVKANLVDSTFIHLRLNLILFVNSSGEVVFSKGFDLQQEREVPVPSQLLDNSSRARLLGSGNGEESSVSGIILLDEGTMMIASQPILKTDGTGPVRGTLIFGRYLDATETSRVAQLTLSNVTVRRIDRIGDLDSQKALNSLSAEKPIFVQPLSTRDIAGYSLLNNVQGNPILMLRVDESRNDYLLGQSAVAYHILVVLVIGVLASVVVLFVVQTQILSRFAIIYGGLRKIADSGDLTTRIPVVGNDELTLVAGTMNGLLAGLEESAAELRAREQRYRLLADNVRDIIFTMDLNFKFSYISPSVTQVTGYTVEEMMSKTVTEILTTTSIPVVTETIAKRITSQNVAELDLLTPETVEVELIRKDGSTVWVEINATFLRDSDGRPIGFIGVARDITERKEAQQTLTRLYEAERRLRQDLQAEIAKRMEYTRALVHELKTPITPIIAAAELLAEEIRGTSLVSLVESINRSANNLNRRIDELLDLARSELNILRIYPEPMDPKALLEEIANEMIPLALRNRQVIVAEIPPSLPQVHAERDRIRQVILNLLNNALKFTPPGGKITLSARQDSANLVVSVSDTGTGMSEEQQKRLFDPYSRVEDDRQRLSGLGLGLALAKKFVELHGGQIWVRTEKDKGSTFSFSLPLAADKKETGIEPGGKL